MTEKEVKLVRKLSAPEAKKQEEEHINQPNIVLCWNINMFVLWVEILFPRYFPELGNLSRL